MEKYISLTEVCKITGMTRQGLAWHRKQGNLKSFSPKGSRRVLFTEKQVEDFLYSKLPEENLPYRNMKEGKAIWGRIQSRLTVEEKAKIAESSFKTTGLYLKTMKELEKKYPAAANNES